MMNHNLAHAPTKARNLLAQLDDLPALAAAHEAHRAAAAAEWTETIGLEAAALTATAEEIVDLIRRSATEAAARDAFPAERGRALEALARRILRELVAAGPEVIARLAPKFDEAAERFTTAWADLPADTTADSLVRAGSTVLQRFEEAEAAAAVMNELHAIRQDLADLGVIAPGGDGRTEKATRYLVVDTPEALEALRYARNEGPLRPWAGYLNVPGVRGLKWRTIEEQTAELARLSPPPRVKPDPTVKVRERAPLSRA